MAESQRRRNRHDAGGHQHLSVQAKIDVGNQNRASDGRKSTRHNLVDLGLGQVRNERLNQHGTLSLTDERCCGRDNCLCTGDTHAPEEEDGELCNEPLDDAPVVQHLHEGNEEDDGGNNASDEPGQFRNIFVCQEDDTVASEAEQLTRQQ